MSAKRCKHKKKLMAEFDPDQLERLMVAAFELLGKPVDQAQELATAILKSAELRQSDDAELRDPT